MTCDTLFMPMAPYVRTVDYCSTMKLTVIIPCFNSSQWIVSTIDSLLAQRNCRWEAICIDAESEDTTVEIVRSYEDSRIRVQSFPKYHIYEMLNRGIAMAQGGYVLILFPGDSFLYPNAISLMMTAITEEEFPDIFYSACMVRDEKLIPHFIFRRCVQEILREGKQPTILQACCIKKTVFKKSGYFNTQLQFRGAFDFFCRIVTEGQYSIASEARVFVDPLPGSFTLTLLWRYFKETFVIIRQYFGLWYAFQWLVVQKDIARLLRRAWQFFCRAFSKK